MTKKEMTEIFSVMLLAWPNAEMFKGGVAKLGPTIELWTACLSDVDFWLGQQAVIRLCRECKFPPSIAEFKEKADNVQQEIRSRIDLDWNDIKFSRLLDKAPQEWYQRLPPNSDVKAVIDAGRRGEVRHQGRRGMELLRVPGYVRKVDTKRSARGGGAADLREKEGVESMRTRKSYRRRVWAQRIMLVLLLAVVATLVIARIGAEPVAGEVSTTPETAPQETAVLRPEPTYVVEVIPTPEPTPTVVARYADVTMTEAERDELAAIIYLEARGEPAEGQQAVAEVVLNRVVSPDFPDSVSEVLHQGEGTAVPQFSTIGLLSAAEPGQAQYDAIDAALYGPSILPVDVVFFSRNGENDRVWGKIGGHVFCYAYVWE